MVKFSTYLAEKMNESGKHAVSVQDFFKKGPQSHFQEDIPTILRALERGKLHPRQKWIAFSKLIPTQELVDLKKVVRKFETEDDPMHIMVVFQDADNLYLIDGHHRACANVLRGVKGAPMTYLTPEDVARILKLKN